MEWTEGKSGWWTATGHTGTRWDIVYQPNNLQGDYGIIVANWDRPDWYRNTLEEAKCLAEERDAAPPCSGPSIIDTVSD